MEVKPRERFQWDGEEEARMPVPARVLAGVGFDAETISVEAWISIARAELRATVREQVREALGAPVPEPARSHSAVHVSPALVPPRPALRLVKGGSR